MKTKVVSVLLAAIMVFSILPITIFAANEKLELSVTTNQNGKIEAGDTVTVTVDITSCAGSLTAPAIKLLFDNDSFTVGTPTPGYPTGLEALGMVNAKQDEGYVAYSAGGMMSDASNVTAMTIISVPFTAKKDIDTPVEFKVVDNGTCFNNGTTAISPTGDLNEWITVYFTGTQEISVTAPVKGATPQNTIASATGYNGTISWEGNPTKFAANTVYSANITLTAKEGYAFASNATGSVSGATVTDNSVSSNGKTLSFKATFPKTADKDVPTCVAPTGLTAIYGQTLANITLTNPVGNTAGTWSWVEPTTSVGNVGQKNFKATFTPTNTDDYAIIENIDVSVTVNPKQITVAISDIADQQYTGSQITPTVTVTGDSKTLVLNTDYTVEYGTNKNVGTNAGSVTVKAKSGSNYTFSNTTKNFNIVAQAGQVTISGNLNVTYPNAIPNLTVDKHGSDGNVTVYYYTNEACTAGKTSTKPTNAGNYWAQAEMAAGTNYGSAVSNVLAFTISRADVSPSAPSGVTATYGQSLADITLENPAGNMSGTWSWMSSATLVGNVGTRTFKAKFTPTDSTNYNVAENIDVSVTVNPKQIDITIADIADQQYTGNQIKPTVTVTGGNKTLVLDTDYTVEYGTNKNVGTNAGSVTVKSKSGSNYTFSNTTKNFNIVAQAGQVTISGNLNVTYPNAIPNVSIDKHGSDGDVTVYYYTNEACTTGKTATKPTDAGNYWAKAEMTAGTNFGSAISNALAFTISRADFTPSVSITDWTYLDGANTPSVSENTSNGAVTYQYKIKGANDSTYSVTVPTNAGDYTVKATIAQTTNYNSASATADFKINPKDISGVTISNITNQKYTGSAIKPQPGVKDGTKDLVLNTDFTYSYENNTNVGTTATVKVIGKGNYTGTATKNFEIIRADLTVTVDITGWIVGGTANAPTVNGNLGNGAVSYQYKVKGANDSTYSATVPTAVGEYTVKATVAQTANYTGATATADFTISTKASQTVTASNITVAFGDSGKSVSATTNGNGTISYAVKSGSDVVDVNSTTGALTIKKVGTATITVTASETATHASATKDITITVNPKGIAIPVADTTIYTYNGNEQTYKITANDAYTVTGNKQTNANETGYTVTVSLKDTANYQWSDGSTTARTYTFIIKKATITITANDKVANAGDEVPVLGDNDYTVDGLVNGETLKTKPTLSYEVTPDMSKAGTATIIASGAVAPDGGNYNDIVYVNGTLTIAKDADEYEWLWYYIMMLHNQKFKITATATEGGAITPAGITEVKYNNNQTYVITPAEGYVIADVVVDGKSIGAVTEYTFNRVTKAHSISATFTKIVVPDEPVDESCDGGKDCISKIFNDVDQTQWYHEAIDYVVENGLMNGVGGNLFDINGTTTRAQIVTILWRLEGAPVVNYLMTFDDVEAESWYTEAIRWAASEGIVNGYSDEAFGPNDYITREQLATIIYRYEQHKGGGFKEMWMYRMDYADLAEVSDWAYEAIAWCNMNGIINGKGDNILDPKGNAKRCEAAAMLMRYIEKED